MKQIFLFPERTGSGLRMPNIDSALLVLACCCLALFPETLRASEVNPELWRPLGVTSALLGGGVGHVTDASAADSNPAGIALQKTYMVGGDMGWFGQKAFQAETGACDSLTSEIAACFKFRQTQKITGAQDRRYTLAMAEPVGGGFILGIGGDYVQFAADRAQPAGVPPTRNGQRLRAGVTYALADGVMAGVRSEGLYDSTGNPRNHGAGLSLNLGRYFVMNGDLRFGSDSLNELVTGVTIFPRDFLDLALSYGYDPKGSHHRTGAGVVVKSQQARLIYSVVYSSAKSKQLFHAVGLGVFMAADSGQR